MATKRTSMHLLGQFYPRLDEAVASSTGAAQPNLKHESWSEKMKPVDISHKAVLAGLGLTNDVIVYMQESIWNNIEYEEDKIVEKWMCQDLYTAALLELSDLEKAGEVARHQGPNNIVMFSSAWDEYMSELPENCDLMLMHRPSRSSG